MVFRGSEGLMRDAIGATLLVPRGFRLLVARGFRL